MKSKTASANGDAVLKYVPPANPISIVIHALTMAVGGINRDRNGEPKTIPFGGDRRCIQSPQSFMAALRDAMHDPTVNPDNFIARDGICTAWIRDAFVERAATRIPDLAVRNAIGTSIAFVFRDDADGKGVVNKWSFVEIDSIVDQVVALSEDDRSKLMDPMAGVCQALSEAAADALPADAAAEVAQNVSNVLSFFVQDKVAASLGLKVRADEWGEEEVQAAVAHLNELHESSRCDFDKVVGHKPKKKDRSIRVDPLRDLVKKKIKVVNSPPLSAILTGRMDASGTLSQVNGCVTTIGGIGVHEHRDSVDYFTARDDLNPVAGRKGAGHIGERKIAGTLMYQYVSLNLTDLQSWLALRGDKPEMAGRIVRSLLQAHWFMLPAGGRKWGGGLTEPSIAIYEARRDFLGRSLFNAFATPVPARSGELASLAARKLVERWSLSQARPAAAACLGTDPQALAHAPGDLRRVKTISEVADSLFAALQPQVKGVVA